MDALKTCDCSLFNGPCWPHGQKFPGNFADWLRTQHPSPCTKLFHPFPFILMSKVVKTQWWLQRVPVTQLWIYYEDISTLEDTLLWIRESKALRISISESTKMDNILERGKHSSGWLWPARCSWPECFFFCCFFWSLYKFKGSRKLGRPWSRPCIYT